MEIQQRDNETLAAYMHHFKTKAKMCDFNSDTAAIHIFVKGLWDAHNIVAKINERNPQTLLQVYKLMKKLNTAQQVTATLTLLTVNMMSNDDRCFYVARQVTLVATAMMHSVITVMTLVTSCRTVQRKFPYQEHPTAMTDHASNLFTTTTTGTDQSPFITDASREDASIGQGHTINLNVTKAPASIGGMHSTLYATTAAAHNTHPLKDTLGNTLTRTHHIGTTVTYLQHAMLHAMITLQIEASPVQDTLTILPADHTHRRHQSHIYGINTSYTSASEEGHH